MKKFKKKTQVFLAALFLICVAVIFLGYGRFVKAEDCQESKNFSDIRVTETSSFPDFFGTHHQACIQ